MDSFVIFIPGIFGSSLTKCGETVWPIDNLCKLKIAMTNIIEKPINSIIPKDKIEPKIPTSVKELVVKLSDKNLIPGHVTNNYKNMITMLKETMNDNFFIFTYDWRNSINNIIENFNNSLSKLEIGSKDIIIVGHSAGGLIAHKYVNENVEEYKNNVNFSKIKKIITIGSPLQGSIKALTAVLGLLPQNLLTPSETKEVLNTGFFSSIFDLCPYNVHNLFYHKDTGLSLTTKQVVKVLNQNGFHSDNLKDFIKMKTEMQNLSINEKVSYLNISGTYYKPMCSSFIVDVENGSLECVYDYGSGDGTVLKDETSLPPGFSCRKINVLGKHVYLTEIDEVLNIVKEEILSTPTGAIALYADVVSRIKKEVSFNLYFIKKNKKYYITDFNAESVCFSRKTLYEDITKKINKRKNDEPSVFYFKTNQDFGFIKFTNMTFKYKDNESDKLQTEFIKYVKIELVEQNDIFF